MLRGELQTRASPAAWVHRARGPETHLCCPVEGVPKRTLEHGPALQHTPKRLLSCPWFPSRQWFYSSVVYVTGFSQGPTAMC